MVYKSDTVIEPQLIQELASAVKPLEEVPDAEKDWHPGSNNQVLDLVHPSLFPLVYGRSRLLTAGNVPLADASLSCGGGICTTVPCSEETRNFEEHNLHPRHGYGDHTTVAVYSKRFQWLPCDVLPQPTGSVHINSYINSLHPTRHSDLYATLEKVIAKAIPMWDAALTEISKEGLREPVFTSIYGYDKPNATHGYYPPRIRIHGPEWEVNRPAIFENNEEREAYDGWVDALETHGYYSRGADPATYANNRIWY